MRKVMKIVLILLGVVLILLIAVFFTLNRSFQMGAEIMTSRKGIMSAFSPMNHWRCGTQIRVHLRQATPSLPLIMNPSER